MSLRPSDLTVRFIAVVGGGAALMTTASCGTATQARPAAETAASGPTSVAAAQDPFGDCGGFALSLASDRGGQASPVDAAERFAGLEGVPDVPESGWQEDDQDENGVIVRSGDATLHVIQGPDKTWQVDSGSTC